MHPVHEGLRIRGDVLAFDVEQSVQDHLVVALLAGDARERHVPGVITGPGGRLAARGFSGLENNAICGPHDASLKATEVASGLEHGLLLEISELGQFLKILGDLAGRAGPVHILQLRGQVYLHGFLVFADALCVHEILAVRAVKAEIFKVKVVSIAHRAGVEIEARPLLNVLHLPRVSLILASLRCVLDSLVRQMRFCLATFAVELAG